MAPDIVARFEEAPIDDSMTLQLKLEVEHVETGITNTVSVVWFKGDGPASPSQTLQEKGSDPALAGAAERAAATAIDVENQFAQVDRASRPDFEYDAPDGEVVYVDSGGKEHEI